VIVQPLERAEVQKRLAHSWVTALLLSALLLLSAVWRVPRCSILHLAGLGTPGAPCVTCVTGPLPAAGNVSSCSLVVSNEQRAGFAVGRYDCQRHLA